LQVGSCGSGELFFACTFLFAASPSCEGGEKLHYGEKQNAEVPIGQKGVVK
jgi:hypothetical protein